MKRTLPASSIVAFLAWSVSVAFAGEQPTTTPTSLTDEFGHALRQRLGDYQPLIEQWRKRAGGEVQKLQQWEYKVVAARTSDTVELTALLNRWGEQGWECFHVASGAPSANGGLPTEHLLFFRKRKGSWIAQLPLRDLLKLLLYLSSESGETQSSP